jgi:hypothetical protein
MKKLKRNRRERRGGGERKERENYTPSSLCVLRVFLRVLCGFSSNQTE